MNRATPKLRNFAERLMAHEMKGMKDAANNPAAFPISEKLQTPLATLMGKGGFCGLLSRALALADREVPWLRAVQVRTDGSLELAGEVEARGNEIAEGRVVLLAHLLGLLVTFIGEILTLRLIQETWPGFSADDFDTTQDIL